jgi:hypothetical protein
VKLKPTGLKPAVRPKTTLIRTTFMDLLQQLTNLTKDDALAVATLKNIFDCYNVRLVRSLTPVRLMVASPRSQGNRLVRRRFSRA